MFTQKLPTAALASLSCQATILYVTVTVVLCRRQFTFWRPLATAGCNYLRSLSHVNPTPIYKEKNKED